jgi:hypothetical protein
MRGFHQGQRRQRASPKGRIYGCNILFVTNEFYLASRGEPYMTPPFDHNGTPWLSAADLARAMDYKAIDAVSRIYRRNSDEFTPDMTETVKLTASAKNKDLQNETRIFSPRGCHLIAMLSKTAKAKAFRHWVLDVLNDINNTKAEEPTKVRQPIRSRDDLAFTVRDDNNGMINWRVPHDHNGNWHDGLDIGYSHFNEVAELASNNELDTFLAVRFALSGSIEFKRGLTTEFQNGGWGIEDGFAEEVARAVIDGLRARRAGATPYDEKAKKTKTKQLPKAKAPKALPPPTLTKEQKQAINKKAYATVKGNNQKHFEEVRDKLLTEALNNKASD